MSVLKTLEGIHKAVHEDGAYVLGSIISTAREMFEDRGYDDICVSPDPGECADCPTPQPAIEATRPAFDGGGSATRVLLYVHNEERVGVKYVRAILERVSGRPKLILVSRKGPTSFTRNSTKGVDVEFFLATELCYNVTRHTLVPKHVRVERDAEHLPVISRSDPVVRYHDWSVGTVVKVVRAYGGHEAVPYFRVVAP